MKITVDEIKLKGVRVDRGDLGKSFNLDQLLEQITAKVDNPKLQRLISKVIIDFFNFKDIENEYWATFKSIWHYYTDNSFYLTRELAYSEEIKNTMAFIKTNPSVEEIRSMYKKCLNDGIENTSLNKYDFHLLEMIKIKHKIEVEICNIRAVESKTAADIIVKIPLEITN